MEHKISNGVPENVLPSEDTPLLSGSDDGYDNHHNGVTPSSQGSGVSSSDRNSTASESSDSDKVRVEDPWPRSFERSISLLAKPHFNVRNVSDLTRSPRFTHFHSRRQRKMNSRLKQINRGFYTPEPRVTAESPVSPTTYSDMFSKVLIKVKSLDFKPASRQHDNDLFTRMDQKRANAKVYRAQILAKHSIDDAREEDYECGINGNQEKSMYSPGYKREEKSDRMISKRKQQEKKRDAHAGSASDEKASFSQCVFNMANILMGVGLLGLPFVMKSAGFYGGIATMIIFGGITCRTSLLIGQELNGDPRPSNFFDDSPFKSPLEPGSSSLARMRNPLRSFPDIAREAFGDHGCVILASVLYFELFSCLGIFFVSMGEHLNELFPSISVEKHMTLVAIAVTVPTAVLRTPRLLSYLSAVGTFSTVAVILTVVMSATSNGNVTAIIAEEDGLDPNALYHHRWNGDGIAIALGLVAYSFSGHAIVPSVYTSMEKPQEFDSMIKFTFILVLLSCLLVGCSGYYMFGDLVVDQVTLSIASYDDNGGTAWLTWLMVITAFSKFTLTMFPLALGVEEIVAPYIVNEESADFIAGIIRILLIILALLVAIYFPSFSFLCSLVGLICTMIVSVIFPAAAHLALFGSRLPQIEKLLDICFIVFGTIAAVIGTVATIQ